MKNMLTMVWLAGLAFIGGSLGFASRFKKLHDGIVSKPRMLYYYSLSVAGSMFVAYIVYEVAFYISNATGISVAIAGFASYVGTDVLVNAQTMILDTLRKLIDKKVG